MDNECIFLGIKVESGPIERYKLENFGLENTVDRLKNEAEKKTSIPSESLELVHHGKILKGSTTLKACGVKNGEMVHVVRKKEDPTTETTQTFSDTELQQILSALRTFGCTPNAPGWTRAMQVLNDDRTLADLTETVPSLNEDCVTLSILHEVELLAAIGANVATMRRATNALPDLPVALRHLIGLVRSRSFASSTDNVPTTGYSYSLEGLSEDEEGDEEDTEDSGSNTITHEQLAAALQAATEAVSSTSTSRPAAQSSVSSSNENLLRLLQTPGSDPSTTATPTHLMQRLITPEMFSNAISEAMNRVTATSAREEPATPMDQSAAAASSSQSPGSSEDFSVQIQHMHDMGLRDDSLNVRALLICAGDVNAAINLVFSGAIDE